MDLSNINTALVWGVAAAHGLYLIGQRVNKIETTPDALRERMDRIESAQALTHKKANETQAAIADLYGDLAEKHVSKGTFDQFLQRFDALERRYNAAHNGSPHR